MEEQTPPGSSLPPPAPDAPTSSPVPAPPPGDAGSDTPPSLPSLPSSPPPSPPATDDSTRHVPDSSIMPGTGALPPATPSIEDFERPDLEPMGPPTVAVLAGRALIAVAALLVGLAARRGASRTADTYEFWSVVVSAGVLTAVGLATMVFWTAALAANARRLRARSSTPWATVGGWSLVVAWVAVSCVTYLRVDVGGDFDPLPAVAGLGWVLTMAVAYGRLQGVFRSLTRRPPIVWLTAFPIDAAALGLVWWRLTSWPSPVAGEVDHARLTANIAFGASAALAVNVFVFGWLTHRAGNALFERIGRLEALHRADRPTEPDWFRAGLAAREHIVDVDVPARPLIATRHLSIAVAALHALWGLALIASGAVIAQLAFEYSDRSVFVGDAVVIDDSDERRLTTVAVVLAVAYVLAVVAHGIWAIVTALNGRRVTVHSPDPATFAVAFAPAPLLLVAGVVAGGRLGYWLFVAGLLVGFLALLLVNQMLLALSVRLGGRSEGFSRWTLAIALTYVAAAAANILFAAATDQPGVYAAVAIVQGGLVVAGAVVGLGAMRDLERAIAGHRQVRRAGPDGVRSATSAVDPTGVTAAASPAPPPDTA